MERVIFLVLLQIRFHQNHISLFVLEEECFDYYESKVCTLLDETELVSDSDEGWVFHSAIQNRQNLLLVPSSAER
jgi:hypothetical protein